MYSIQTFNQRLNESLQTNHKTLRDFRHKIDQLFKDTLKEMENTKDICIIGAGKMREFSLSFLLRFCQHMTLYDIDIETVKQSVEALQLSDEAMNKIVYHQVDVTGFEQINFFKNLIALFQKPLNYKKLDQFLTTHFKQLESYTFFDDKYYDVIYVSPIYTQLVYYQLLTVCAHIRQRTTEEHYIKYVEGQVLDYMPTLLNRFNQSLYRHLKKEGQLIVMSDIFELEEGSQFEREIKESMKNNTMNDHYRRYRDTYGMGLGDFGLYNLEEYLKKGFEQWLIWPFSDNKEYVVKIQTYTHNKGGSL
ncbi:MAG: hypothetical protein UMR38_00965 [Candidatus Izemoplasma sp.]|nr:hypothetical protein [Candidatus Izemoplasma sp.]